jgi:hypothetical protein
MALTGLKEFARQLSVIHEIPVAAAEDIVEFRFNQHYRDGYRHAELTWPQLAEVDCKEEYAHG